MIEAVIFDMDGVIIDSEPFYLKAISRFLEKKKITVSKEELISLAGISSREYAHLLEKWAVRSGMESSSDTKSLYDLYCIECDAFAMAYERMVFPDIEKIMHVIKGRGLKLAIASSSPKHDIQCMLAATKLESYVDAIISGDSVIESKPNPQIYLEMAKMLNVRPNQCVAIEDSPYGIDAGKRAGMMVIARKEDRFGKEFDQSKADYIVDDLRQILDFI